MTFSNADQQGFVQTTGVPRMANYERRKVGYRCRGLYTTQAPSLILINQNDECVLNSMRPSSNRIGTGVKLEKGTYYLWSRYEGKLFSKGDPTWSLHILDTELAYSFPQASTLALKSDTPANTFSIDTTPASPTPASNCAGSAQPSTYLELEKDTQLQVLHGVSKVTVLGPLGESGGVKAARCQSAKRHTLKPGRYALFGTSEPAKQRVTLAHGAWRSLDPFTLTTPVPENAPLEARELGRYYGVAALTMRDMKNVDELFEQVPAGLFVFATEARSGLKRGEPLLLLKHGTEKSKVLRMNANKVQVRTSTLSTQAPASITLPKLAPLTEFSKYDGIYKSLGFSERALAKPIGEQWTLYKNCVHQYRAKNDPTYGARYKLVNKRTGKTLGAKILAKAKKKCLLSKKQAFEKKQLKKINGSLKKRRKTALQAMEKKF